MKDDNKGSCELFQLNGVPFLLNKHTNILLFEYFKLFVQQFTF